MNFSKEVIDNICYSMENCPDEWTIETLTMKHISGIELWHHDNRFTYWNGRSSENVFSEEERKRIKESFKILINNKQTLAQQKITKCFSKPKEKNTYIKNSSIWDDILDLFK